MVESIMDGRVWRSRLALGILPLALMISGCAGSSGPRAVQVSLIAPTSGATVVVRRILVTGSVQPAQSKVVVADHLAPNHHGHFGVWLPLGRGLTHIHINAAASGYQTAALDVAVRRTVPTQATKRRPLEQSAPRLADLGVNAWTPAARSTALNACLASGGWQSYCKCAMRYVVAAGPPRQMASSLLAARSRRRLPSWMKQTVIHCL
jgi:hypothetical protein